MTDSKQKDKFTESLTSAPETYDLASSFEWEGYTSWDDEQDDAGPSTRPSSNRVAMVSSASTGHQAESTNTTSSPRIINASGHGGCVSQEDSNATTSHSNQDDGCDDLKTVSELDDCLCALTLQIMAITEDRGTGRLGKAASESDAQIAVEHFLQETRELTETFKLVKCILTSGSVPVNLIEEMEQQDRAAIYDRELAERIGRGDSNAEISLQSETSHFHRVLQSFSTVAECCSCNSTKQAHLAKCGHAYCEACAKSLFNHALKNRMFIPVRCCKIEFTPEIAVVCLDNTEALDRYNAIKNEIENPCPSIVELDKAAADTISKNGWKLCSRCGAVVERAWGCVHITCICRYEFCYTCGEKWRTCRCELYPEDELNQILDERIRDNDPAPARNRVRNVLRNYYDHAHNWKRRRPYGRVCSVCNLAMPIYCMYCRVCRETRCWRYTFNN
ncbi:hypothetical protein BGZ79_001697 [Entomortierella chlamydospora]|nr:hypothetical protein BGZ79_001697 [Entomortierella chlamydospora]